MTLVGTIGSFSTFGIGPQTPQPATLTDAQKQALLAALSTDPRFAALVPALQSLLGAPLAGVTCADAADMMFLPPFPSAMPQDHARIWSDTQHSVRNLLTLVSRLENHESQPVVKLALGAMSTKLAAACAPLQGNYLVLGDAARTARTVVTAVASELRALAPIANAKLPPKTTFALLAEATKLNPCNAAGDGDYDWTLARLHATATATNVSQSLTKIAPTLSDPEKTIVGNFAAQLAGIEKINMNNIPTRRQQYEEVKRIMDSVSAMLRGMSAQ